MKEILMAEGTPGPGLEAASPTGEGKAGTNAPYHFSKELYDPKKTDYITEDKGDRWVYKHPKTGQEVAWTLKEGTENISSSVAAVSQAGYIEPTVSSLGGQVSESAKAILEVKNQLQVENRLNPEGKNPAQIVEILQEIDSMDAETRERQDHKDYYQQACAIVKEYAHKDKLLYQAPEVTREEMKLKEWDEKELENKTAENRIILQNSFDQLDATEEELVRVNNTLGLKATHEKLFTKKVWEDLEEKQQGLEKERQEFRLNVGNQTSPGFLSGRIKRKTEFKEFAKAWDAKDKQERIESLQSLQLKAEPWEEELEEKLLEDQEPIVPQTAVKASFSEQLKFFEEQQRLKETGDPNFRQPDLDQAEQGESWYFYHAGKAGVFTDLKERLDQKYQKLAASLMTHREISQQELMMGMRGHLERKTLAELEDEITEYFGNLLDSTKPQYVEHANRWDILQRRGLSGVARGQLQGIRAEYVQRALIQMEDSLANLDQAINKKGLGTLPINRLPGEWNVRELEREMEQNEKRQKLAEGREPLFKEESYWKITLLGDSRQEIEQGADQAADNIINSATTFSLDVIRERTSLLLRAIEERTSDLQAREGISKQQARDMIDQIKRKTTNKLDFYVLDFLAGNLLMDQFSGYLEERMRIDGVEKLRMVPAMNDGLAGLALYLLMDPKYRLFFRPQGFKGQIFDDDTTHKYIRKELTDQIVSLLMQYKLKGKEDKDQTETREKLLKSSSKEDFLTNFEVLPESPKKSMENAKTNYENTLKRVEKANTEGTATMQDLQDLQNARKIYAERQNYCQEIEGRARSAFTTAIEVMNIFGESAALGAPSIKMDKGDYIRVEDAAQFYKYAILQAAKSYKPTHGAEDNLALIRWRSKEWIQRWKEQGLDRKRTNRKFQQGEKGNLLPVELQDGFEETGLTKEEWKAFEEAVGALRQNGYTAKFRGVKFEDIMKMDHLKPVMNNFLADYKSSESQINNEVVLKEVAKGKLKPIAKILMRLGIGREGIKGNTTQQRIDNLTQMIEDSRALDAELERLAYFEATHGLPQVGQDPRMLPFLADRIDFGFQGMPWGVKRLQHLKAFWYTNLRRTVPRAVDLIHAMPFAFGSLSKEMDFDNILDLCLNIQTSASGLTGMESVDNPGLVMYAQRWKDMVVIRGAGEGSVAVGQDGTKKVWGFFEKPLVDANSLWKTMRFEPQKLAKENVEDARKDPRGKMGLEVRENIINYLQETILKRIEPIITATEKLLGEDRQALSSGAGYEENEKFALRLLEWLLLSKKGSRREQGGMEVNKEIQDILKLIAIPGSYREGFSIWDEVWRKLTPSHNPALSDQAPKPTI